MGLRATPKARGHGKSAFARIEDQTGYIQLYFKKDVLGDEAFARLRLIDLDREWYQFCRFPTWLLQEDGNRCGEVLLPPA